MGGVGPQSLPPKGTSSPGHLEFSVRLITTQIITKGYSQAVLKLEGMTAWGNKESKECLRPNIFGNTAASESTSW